ncbi:hypothetical protein [Vibrio vulnificus]|uniref:hypothetical protein n=1 Tax=Vibrio vulnificus TaxID=672 RepID=UPI001028D714|nr:hypothetical protein [Vibrio vulnificus]EGQ8024385.1 hypothetical protein [Vibrio vulnificus]ELV8693055.1 hypothetical protein [Vibrio vulnificus]RZQ72808.1 hypothetical protein D8T30_12860 [Vibrio vulnificus]RZQ79063.1 hypothetical protein D8T30_01850 [Vibrio vulnificus]RZQ97875.1 hypothetical protein D8T29_12730 [Vibrio vulnificus]
MEAAVWGFIGTIVGALASICTSAISSWNSHALAIKEKNFEREEMAKEFQRKTILELQKELPEYIRSCDQIYRNFRNHHENTGRWEYSISDELDIENRNLTLRVINLIQRIENDELRESLVKLQNNCTACLFAKERGDADRFYAEFLQGFQGILELLGEVLRTTYWQKNA